MSKTANGRLSGKIALIAGGASGMGRATAELFSEEGANVLVGDIKDAEPYENDIAFTNLDVTNEEDWQSAVSRIENEHGKLDVLVNTAGVLYYDSIHEMDIDQWERDNAVNGTGVFLGMRETIPIMRQSNGGSIVNFSSIWGSVAVSGAAAYHASKAAVRNLSKNAAVTYAEDGIRVNSVHPGIINTPMIESQDEKVSAEVVSNTPLNRRGEPEEVAYTILFLASEESSFMTGAELVVDGGYLAR